MSTARQPEPFRPPHDPAICAVCLCMDKLAARGHDPATCPGCLRAAMPDYAADPEQDTGGAAAWAVAALGIALVGLVFIVTLYLIFSNDLAVLAR